jgi:glycosyltransferase involved in cell wall biosynthesis
LRERVAMTAVPTTSATAVTEATSPRNATAQAVDASVLVPVFNEERYIERSVAAMRRQRFDGKLEFLFADGGSTDRTREILDALAAEDPRIRLFENPRRSVSSGLNVAFRHARGRWVVRMDAHTEYPDEYVSLGVRRLRRGGTRWVSGPQVPKGVGPVSRAVALALTSRLGRGGSRKWGEQRLSSDAEWELDTGVFAGVWERETLLEYGGWDERWVSNEDSEMAGRFLARGERLVCLASMGADYVPRDSLAGLWRQYLGYGEYRIRTAVRHPHTLRASNLLAPAVVLDASLACGGPRRIRRAARAGLKLYLAAIAVAGIRALPRAEPKSDALLVPGVLAIMHFGHGVGMLVGAVRDEPPLAALASIAGLGSSADSAAPGQEAVFAPSLS